MFLEEIRSRPARGMAGLALRTLRRSGEAVPEILHLFRFKRSTKHLVRFTEAVMRGPSPLSRGLRELIGAYVSHQSRCSFCCDAHAAAASGYLDPQLVKEVLGDLEGSRLDEAHKELFRYAGKLARDPSRVTAADVERVRQAGWSEEAIYDVLTVAALFRFYNTWNGGAGVQEMTPADYAYSGRVLRTLGYCMDFTMTRLVRMPPRQIFAVLRTAFAGRGAAPSSDVARGQSVNESA